MWPALSVGDSGPLSQGGLNGELGRKVSMVTVGE